MTSKIMVLPDMQVKDEVDLSYLTDVGKYLVYKRPDIVVCMGDFADMPSLSSYSVGKKEFEGRRYRKDVEVTHKAMDMLLGPLREFNIAAKKNKHKPYKPRLVMLYGNHEDRITRCINQDAKLEGVLSLEDLGYAKHGWEVHKFLDVVVIEGIAFSHYFTSGVMGRPVTTAAALLSKKHMSCIAGHQQGRQSAHSTRADGKQMTAIICGSCYTHNEDYMGPQGNTHYRGLIMLHNAADGNFEEMYVTLDYLKGKYNDGAKAV